MHRSNIVLTFFLVMLMAGCQPPYRVVPVPSIAPESTRDAALTGQYNAALAAFGSTLPPQDVLDSLPAVTPDVITRQFEADQLQADRAYGDRWLKIRGTVFYGPTNDGFEGLDYYYLGLAHNNKSMAFIFFGKQHEAQLQALQKGQEVVVVGVYIPGERYTAKLIGCTLLAPGGAEVRSAPVLSPTQVSPDMPRSGDTETNLP